MIKISQPALHGREKEYVNDALDSNEIATGKYVGMFERETARVAGCNFGVSCCSGTAALILALRAIGLQPNHEVIVPSLTYIATANAVAYFGAKPIIVDVDPETWCIDTEQVKKSITLKTKAIIPVHLYGHPSDMDELKMENRPDIYVIEDAAEAIGAYYKSRPIGSLGHMGCFSFYGNKIITTGEGGMVTTSNGELARLACNYRDSYQSPDRRYLHYDIGFNFRLNNISSAIGVGQIQNIQKLTAKRKEVLNWYRDLLSDAPVTFQGNADYALIAPWMMNIVLNDDVHQSVYTMGEELKLRGVETRPLFYPLHMQVPYRQPGVHCPVSEKLAARGISLPTHPDLTYSNVEKVIAEVKNVLKS